MILAEIMTKFTGDSASLEAASKSADKSLQNTEKQAGKTQDKVKMLASSAKMLGQVLSTYVVAAVAFMAKEFMAGQNAVANLNNSLKNIGIVSEEANKRLLDLSNTLQVTTGYADDQLQDAMAELVKVTGSYSVALKHTATVADFAAAKKMDLKTAATLVGRAFNEGGTVLSRYGVQVSKTAKGMEVLEAVSKTFAGSAAVQAATLAGQIQALKNEFADFAEAGGAGLVPMLENLIDLARDAIPYWTEFGKKFKDFFDEGSNASKVVKALMLPFKYLTDVILPGAMNRFASFFGAIGKAINGDFKGAIKEMYVDTVEMDIMLNKEFGRNVIKMFAEVNEAVDKTKKNIGDSGGLGESVEDAAARAKKAAEELAAQMAKIKKDSEVAAGGVSDTFKAMGKTLVESGWNVSEGLKAASKSSLDAILTSMQMQLQGELATAIGKSFKPIVGALEIPAIAGLATAIGSLEALKAGINAMADGGMLTKPTLTTFAENGPEMAIPLSKLDSVIAGAMNKASGGTNVGGLTVVINAQKIDDNTDFSGVARKMKKALTNLDRQRGV